MSLPQRFKGGCIVISTGLSEPIQSTYESPMDKDKSKLVLVEKLLILYLLHLMFFDHFFSSTNPAAEFLT
jgi:hypothetical protein